MVDGVHGCVTYVHVVEHRDVLEVVTARHLHVEEKIALAQVLTEDHVAVVQVRLCYLAQCKRS